MKVIFNRVIVFVLLLIFFVSCKKASTDMPTELNKPPIAHAGPDQQIFLPKDSSLLSGKAFSGIIATYLWQKIYGPISFSIIDANSAETKVKNLQQGIYEFELRVTNFKGLVAKDTVQIIVMTHQNVSNSIACAGADQVIILPVNAVHLDGSCGAYWDYDKDYTWTKIVGPSTFTITKPKESVTQVRDLVKGVYQFELNVNNGFVIVKDTVQINVN